MDNLTPTQRSYCMSRVKGKDTTPERFLRSRLHRLGFRFQKHCVGLPGKPDVVFRQLKVAVFVDGEFWHGFRFPFWKEKVSGFWQRKIAGNRARDIRNFRRLRRSGWIVIRIWQRQLERKPEACVFRVTQALRHRSKPARIY
jgi:DNA mismatch endonuclease (patch repair protein)